MADGFLLALGIILLVIGVAGSVLPLIPGPPLCFISMLILKFTSYVEPDREDNYNDLLWIFAFVTIIVVLLDYIVPIWGTKRYGGSRAGIWGAAAGVVVGMFFGPIGMILGPFIGAVLAEFLTGRDERGSLRAGFGSFIGFLAGVVIKLIASFLMSFYFFREVFVG